MSETKKFRLSQSNKMIAGVCGGIAEYLNIDLNIVRIATVLLAIFTGFGLIAYIVCWIIGANAK